MYNPYRPWPLQVFSQIIEYYQSFQVTNCFCVFYCLSLQRNDESLEVCHGHNRFMDVVKINHV